MKNEIKNSMKAVVERLNNLKDEDERIGIKSSIEYLMKCLADQAAELDEAEKKANDRTFREKVKVISDAGVAVLNFLIGVAVIYCGVFSDANSAFVKGGFLVIASGVISQILLIRRYR